MLGRIFREITRSLRTRHEATSAQDPLDQWKKDYSGAANPVARGQVLQALETWLQQQPDHLLGWIFLGDALQQQRQLEAAESAYRRALRIDPTHAAAHEGVGLVLLHQGKLDQAWLHLEAAHKADPQNPDILVHWGLVALEKKNFGEAAKNFEKAIDRNVNHYHAWHNLGLAQLKMGRPQQGIRSFQRALDIRPEFGLAWSNLALAQCDVENLSDALISAQQAIKFKGESARTWVILADILTDAGEWEQADSALTTAFERDPHDTGGYISLGKLRSAQARYPEAESAYQHALTLEPDNAQAKGGLGQLEMLLGRFDVGFEHYEARRLVDESPVRQWPLESWEGTPIPHQGLLVHSEQGLGDIIIFASCIPDLLAQTSGWNTHVVLETEPRLQGLLQRSFPALKVIGRERSDQSIDWLNDIDCQYEIPIGSLPRLYRSYSHQSIQYLPYLKADSTQVEYWRNKLLARGPGPYVGVSWRGGMLRSGTVQRSINPIALLRELQSIGIQPICLQYGEVESTLNEAAEALNLQVWHWPESLVDMDAAAAITQALDAVVTVCNTQAHLTGGLGKDGWVLVPSNPNWRYGINSKKSWWYPSLNLIRQAPHSNWEAPIKQLSTDLQTWKTTNNSTTITEGKNK
ncbi:MULTISPECIES: tetratricopeptide repeat protein [Giesbergeria]|uniref:Tetratricopeptide repeat protein n=1 Tax=Giesbergeria sinuosa TaxID=80883 RepID=A0ABV9QFU9_9BURK